MSIRPRRLLDLYTIRGKRGAIAGLHVAIIGDILFSRVARSNIFALIKLGARVTLVGPSTLVPREFEQLGVTVSHKLEEVLQTADVVNLLRIQHERQRKEYFPGIGEYIRLFGLTKERAKLLKPDCLIMHPGPINRGVEIDSELADGAAKRDSRSGNQRSRGADGGPLSLRRDRDLMTILYSQRPNHRSGERARRGRRSIIVDGRIAKRSASRQSANQQLMRSMQPV